MPKRAFLDTNVFLDCVQYVSALKTECNYLITANKKHFQHCKIQVMNAMEFLN